jgi:hypothetical protein
MVHFNSLKITPKRSLIVDINILDIPYYEDVYLDSIIIDNQKTYTPSGPSNTPIYCKEIKGERHLDIGNIIKPSLEGTYIIATIKDCTVKIFADKFIPNNYTIKDYSLDGKFIIVKDLKVEFNGKIISFKEATIYFCTPIESIYLVDVAEDTFNVIHHTNSKRFKIEIPEQELLGNIDDLLFVYVKTKGNPAINTPCGEDSEYTLGVTINSGLLYSRAMNYIRELNCECTSPRRFVDLILRYKALMLCLEFGNYTQAIKLYNKYFICENSHSKHHCHECRRNIIR